MFVLALALALAPSASAAKPLSAAWIDPHQQRHITAAAQKAAGVSYFGTSAKDVFVLIKGDHNEVIGSDEGMGAHLYGPAEIQIGNSAGLKEYKLTSGQAICFASPETLNCELGPEMPDW